MESSTEAYLLLLLSDGNLPTGSFVASSGLESLVKHGHFSRSWNERDVVPLAKSPIPQPTEATINFIRDSLQSNAHSTLPFISHAHGIVTGYLSGEGTLESALDEIKRVEALYESMTLNHVTRRASKAQGVALLTLFSKGFAQPSWVTTLQPESAKERRPEEVVDAFKTMVRRGDTHGHLPTCWAVLTASLGLSLSRSQHLHLFLHARAVLSASIRLNTMGPYAAQQLLLHVVRPLVDATLAECQDLRIPPHFDKPTNEDDDGPATTWPLGEILAARHDLQHSRIFNS